MKSLTILSGKAMIVEMPPEWTHEIQPSFGINHDYLWYIVKCENERFHAKDKFFKLPPGTWQIVGMLPEVTEEQAGMLVEKVMNGQHHQNYNYKSVIERWVKTALESLESAIRAEGYYLDNNPVPPFNERLNDWIEALSRVLCRERCLVLRRAD